MAAMVWLWHAAALIYALPLLRLWWNGRPEDGYEHGATAGRSRSSVVASLLLPIISWIWLIPMAHGYRRREREARRLDQVERVEELHRRDVEYWAAQLLSADPVEVQNAELLLEMWGVAVEATKPPQVDRETLAEAWAHAMRARHWLMQVPPEIMGKQPLLLAHEEDARLVRFFDGQRWVSLTEAEYEQWYRLNHRVQLMLRQLDTH